MQGESLVLQDGEKVKGFSQPDGSVLSSDKMAEIDFLCLKSLFLR